MEEPINLLVTLDSHYVKPLRVMLQSLFLNNPGERFSIYILHTNLRPGELRELDGMIRWHGGALTVVPVSPDRFADAPLLFHYTREMYFRLLAPWLLPESLDRVLYLDPDILILNPVRTLYDTDIRRFLYAAAYHNKPTIRQINRIRLHPYGIDAYYNSGVLLMNLRQLRREVWEEDIYRFIRENHTRLVMPDQDILNSLYAGRIRRLDERYYNYDARYYTYYRRTSGGKFDMERILNHTVVLHFCGRKKPWDKNYTGVFLSLYCHYAKLANADAASADTP